MDHSQVKGGGSAGMGPGAGMDHSAGMDYSMDLGPADAKDLASLKKSGMRLE
ncbi:MAG: hypothetical protein HC824_15320 [Synechococcales cyanobacterium RM1_1_8]|nr:hypothetical protein [Synechococcales cyanobacterium RM1_1_8]